MKTILNALLATVIIWACILSGFYLGASPVKYKYRVKILKLKGDTIIVHEKQTNEKSSNMSYMYR